MKNNVKVTKVFGNHFDVTVNGVRVGSVVKVNRSYAPWDARIKGQQFPVKTKAEAIAKVAENA